MRRLLLIFLLLVLPCQMSWAAAARYCQHEDAMPASWHIGHHEHRHEAKQGDHGKKPVIDADCGVCHLASLPMACAALTVEPVFARVQAPAPSVEPTFRSRNPGAPDRPQWSRLA